MTHKPLNPIDPKLVGDTYTPEMRQVFRLLREMTEEQRGLVLCWFCSGCWRYLGPGDYCHCENDE